MGSGRKAKKVRIKGPQPFGTEVDSIAAFQKEESELDLEEAVFGKRSGGQGTIWDAGPVDEAEFLGIQDEESEVETGMETIQDENLFFFDAPEASTSSPLVLPTHHSVSSDSDGELLEDEAEPVRKSATKSTNRRKPVWYDPADEDLTVSLKDSARLRKLRVGPGEDVVGGIEYENRLRRQFEKMHPVPAWAIEARRKIMKKRARQSNGAVGVLGIDYGEEEYSDDGDEDEVDDLFRTARGQRKNARKGMLKPGEIDVDRLRDANQADPSSSTVVSVGFHPQSQVLFSATSDRRLRLFQIDGTDNSLLQTIHVPDLPIATAAFHPSGSSVLMTGQRPFFISYDLQSGTVLRSPRGLLSGGLGGTDKAATGGTGGMERFKFSHDGDLLAVGGRRGYVHLVDWESNGVSNGGQVIGEVKMNVVVKGIAWQKGGKELLTLGEDSEIYVWDVGTRKCITRWRDDGGFGACGIESDGREKYTAIASSTGIVNIYDAKSHATVSGAERKALKAVGNITTSVTSMRFNHDSQILALASRTDKDQLKLIHLPSATVFSNWPSQTTPLHHVTAVDFSSGSEYLAVGNARGKVLLYNLKHYA